MDAELRQFLSEKFDRIDQRFRQVDEKFAALAREMDEKLTTMAQHILHEMDLRLGTVDKKLESIDSRLQLHAGLVQSGARAIARLSQYSESSEARYTELLTRFEDLERRVVRLEPPKQ
ncbi:MAG TPA: hypothetical protein VFC21_06340 [Bryobacteraceae bacterium]|nr:hypothetical protein [Bryobacteraceae bacterium]